MLIQLKKGEKDVFRMYAASKWEKWRAETLFVKEPETIAWINGFDGENSTFWDIGANIGVYSLYCAKVHPNMQIKAFEPMKNNFLRLWQNIFANDFTNVSANFCGFGLSTRVGRFSPGNSEVGASGGQLNSEGYPINIVDGDTFIINHGIPNYIKIDTDGNEYDILRGMWGILYTENVKSVLVEINNYKTEIIKMMADCGLHVDEKLMSIKNRESDNNVIFTR